MTHTHTHTHTRTLQESQGGCGERVGDEADEAAVGEQQAERDGGKATPE